MTDTNTAPQTDPAAPPAPVVQAVAPIVDAATPPVSRQDAVDAQAAAQEAVERPDSTGAGAIAPLPDEDGVEIQLANAMSAIKALNVQLAEAQQNINKAQATYDGLMNEKSKHLGLIEKHKESVSRADSVKRIQQQTVRNLEARKAQTQIAVGALAAAGITMHPSKLDESMANRKRSPEQLKGMATFIHQQAADRNAARTGV